jgi:hypothetical protein
MDYTHNITRFYKNQNSQLIVAQLEQIIIVYTKIHQRHGLYLDKQLN